MNLDLLQAYKDTGDIVVRNQIIERNIPLVKCIVARMGVKGCSEYEFNDLVNYGVFGLINAVEKFDIERGVTFSTFAYKKIYYSIIDELRKIDWVPRSVRSKIKLVYKEMNQVENIFGVEVSVAELAKQYGLTRRDIEIMNGTCISSVEPLLDYIYDARDFNYDYVLC